MRTPFVTEQILRHKPQQAMEQVFERSRSQRLCPKDSVGFPGIADMINKYSEEEEQIVIETCKQIKSPQEMMDADGEAIEIYRRHDLVSFSQADRIVEHFRGRKQRIIAQGEKGLAQPKHVAKALDILQDQQDGALLAFFEDVYRLF